MKLITAENCKNFEELRAGYHERLFDDKGCPFLSSTTIKLLAKDGWGKDTAATLIGERVHKMLENMARGKDYIIALAKERKNSKAYAEELAALEERAASEGKIAILCNNTDYASLKPSYDIGKKFFASIKTEKIAESMAFISAEEVAAFDAEKLSPELKNLHAWIVESGCSVKCSPDLLVKTIGAETYKIYDYKRSAKRSLKEIYSQIHFLNYTFSLFFYRYTLELAGVRTSPSCTLLALTDLDVPIQIEVDTKDAELYKTYVAPILAKPYLDYYKSRYQIMEGNTIFGYTAPSAEKIKQMEVEETSEEEYLV